MENLTDNLNTYLYIAAALLTVVEIFIRLAFPLFRNNPLMETIDSLWIAMVVALCLKATLLQPFTIPSGSMEDTLQVGDYILVKKYEYGYSLLNQTPRFLQFNKPQHRDVVVFVYPDDHSKDFIKRCIGLPGDVIELRNQELFLNGVKQIEPYVKHLETPAIALMDDGPDSKKVNFGPVTVQPGHYFMMGDNRDNSLDSRYWGQVEAKLIKGRAWVIYWHSVGFQTLFAILGLVSAVVSFVMLAFTWIKRPAPLEGQHPDAALKEARKSLFTFMFSAALVGIVLVAWMGLPTFQQNIQVLKDRIFMVIR